MDAIEARVDLPARSEPMTRYSRYYAPGESGKIEALFIIHDPNFVKDVEQFCDAENVKTFPCSAEGKANLAPAGSRKWLDEERDLPIMHGGGCGAIRFSYDPATRELSALQCNAEY